MSEYKVLSENKASNLSNLSLNQYSRRFTGRDLSQRKILQILKVSHVAVEMWYCISVLMFLALLNT